MERHIKESQNKALLGAQSEYLETTPTRERIVQLDSYDQTTETLPEQVAVREMLNSLDEQALIEIFSEYFRKTGSDNETMNWIPLSTVRVLYSDPDSVEKKSIAGEYSSGRGIQIQSERTWHDPNQVLWTLIHEECHAISKGRKYTTAIVNDQQEVTGTQLLAQSGVSLTAFQIADGSDEIKEVSFDNEINEGITELLTERIFREYKRRTGTDIYAQHPTKWEQMIGTSEQFVARSKFEAYGRYWQNAKMYIGVIAALADTPEEIVENSLIRAYIRNHTLLLEIDPEISSILSSIHPDLASLLAKMINSKKSDGVSLGSYMKYLNSYNIPSATQEKILLTLNKIREEWGEAYKLAPHTV